MPITAPPPPPEEKSPAARISPYQIWLGLRRHSNHFIIEWIRLFHRRSVNQIRYNYFSFLCCHLGPQIIVGSSIGAWVMLLSALSAPRRIHGLVGIASAVDFLYQRYEALDLDQKALVEKQGYFPLPSDYSDEPYKIPFPTIKEASEHILLSKPSIEIDCPVRLIHGMNDNVVPYQLSISVAEKLRSVDVRVNLVKNGDHRMSTQEDLRLLERVLDDILQ